MKPSGIPHQMPLPTNVPWKSECMPWSMPTTMQQQNGVVQFSAPGNIMDPLQHRTCRQFKRKSKIIPPLPNKQLITEEKVIAHFNGMHISRNYTEHSAGGASTSDFNSTMDYDFNNLITQKELEEKLKNANRITICDEIKKLHAVHSSFMPNALLQNRIERPCTALVLWTPPAKIEDLITPEQKNFTVKNNGSNIQEDYDEDLEGNNNSSNSNLNITTDATDVADGMDTDL